MMLSFIQAFGKSDRHMKTNLSRGLPKSRNSESENQNPESGIRNEKTKMKIRRHENFNEGQSHLGNSFYSS